MQCLPVHNQVCYLLANSIVTPGIVISSIFLPSHHLLGVEELLVHPGPHLVHHGGLKIHEDGPGHVLASSCLSEEGAEAVVSLGDLLVRQDHPVRLYPVLHAVQLPAGVPHLHSSLTHVHRDTFSLEYKTELKVILHFSDSSRLILLKKDLIYQFKFKIRWYL